MSKLTVLSPTANTAILTCLVIGLVALAACSRGGADSTATDVYDFPMKPGTPAWEALNSHDEMLKVCQIPEETLRRMSTEGLVETVLNYPLYGDMLAYFDLQEGFDSVARSFSGLSELLKRKDAGSVLLTKYRMMDPGAINQTWTLDQQGQYDARFTYIEMLLAQEAILAKLTATQQRDLLAEALRKSQSKQRHAEIYGHFGLERTTLLMGRILQRENYIMQKKIEDIALQEFLRSGTVTTDVVLDEILSQAQEFLSR